MNDARDDKERALRDLISVLQLEKMARAARKHDELAFLMVNDTHRAVKYQQAVLWNFNAADQVRIETMSGVAHVDMGSTYMQHLQRILNAVTESDATNSQHVILQDDLSDALQADWQAVDIQNPLWCPFLDAAGELQGGLLFLRRDAWAQAEMAQMDFIIDAYAHCWLTLTRHRVTWRKRIADFRDTLRKRKVQAAILLVLTAVMLFPVSQTVTAPAEIVAEKPTIMSPPVDGVIRKFFVRPNETVKRGQILFALEDSVIRNRYEVGLKALAVAQADYRRALAKAFSDERSKAEVNLLKAVAAQKAEEVNYAKDLLQRIQVRATRDGIAVFSDVNDWLGKPVSVGQRIITLADPDETELLVWLPVDDAISFPQDARVSAFLNVNPTEPLQATLHQLSYEAQLSPDNVLAFKLRASFAKDVTRPRIGLKATAKVYGETVSLFYYIFRRPLAAVRRFLGW